MRARLNLSVLDLPLVTGVPLFTCSGTYTVLLQGSIKTIKIDVTGQSEEASRKTATASKVITRQLYSETSKMLGRAGQPQ
jgi:hypothetical protein